MAFSNKRTSSTSTGSRAKKPVRFVKTRSEGARSGATPTKRTVSRPRTTAANSRNTSSSTSSSTSAKESPRKKAASRKASNLKTTAQKSADARSTRSTTPRGASSRTASSRSTSSRKPAAAKTLQIAPGTLPSWSDLADSQVIQQNARPEVDHWFGAISTARFVVIILALATVFTLYVGHVFATQDLLTEVQQLRNEQLALQMTQDKLEGELHHVTGPEEIFAAAGELGLSDRVHRGTPIIVTSP